MAGFDSKCRELLKILPELQCFKCEDVPGPGSRGVRLLHKRCAKSAEKGLLSRILLFSEAHDFPVSVDFLAFFDLVCSKINPISV